MANNIYLNRELSWLAFNYRILQEAMDENVPLYERIRFMGLFAGNLDTFYRSRVAALTNLTVLSKKAIKKLNFDPTDLLDKINRKVDNQQEELFAVYNRIIHKELKSHNIHLMDETNLTQKQADFVKTYYKRTVAPHIQPMILIRRKITFFLQNKALYLAIKLISKTRQEIKYALIKIPSPPLKRFITLPEEAHKKGVIFLDDLLRYCLPDIFPGYKIASSYAVKLNRDAEQYSEDEFRIDLINKIEKGLLLRKNEQPSHFLYDKNMPKAYLKFIRKVFDFQKKELIPGGRYHNFNDFISFPNLAGKSFEYKSLKPLPIQILENEKSFFKVMEQLDVLCYFPYHNYEYVFRFINEAIDRDATVSISITLYRVSTDSKIISLLTAAAKKGIQVIAFAEINVSPEKGGSHEWVSELEKSGVRVLYSFPGLKVHAKLCLIEVRKDERTDTYAYLSTGNFNEALASANSDFGFFTTNPKIVSESKRVFQYLTHQDKPKKIKHLLVAPFNIRQQFYRLIENEIKLAREGKRAEMILKLINLQDPAIIKKLYKASRSGVKIRIIVRSICCLIPGIKGLSENIEVISLVDRFSEHARAFKFYNDGDPLYYIGSADWMTRNFDRRVEVVFPIYDNSIKKELNDLLELQWRDNIKARVVEKTLSNPHRPRKEGTAAYRAQTDIYHFLKSKT
jgi:polyphosphate kinase